MTFEEIQLAAFKLTEKESAKLQRQMVAEYAQALKNINKQLKKMYLSTLDGVKPENYYSTITKYNRLVKLSQEVQKLYAEAAKKVNGLQVDNSLLSISNTYYRQFYSMGWVANTVVTPLNPAIIEASVYGTTKVWDELSTAAAKRFISSYGQIDNYLPQSGTLLEEILFKRNAETLASLEQTLRQGLIQGDSYRKMAKSIKGVMGTTTNNALRIAITESHRNMTTGNYAAAKAVQDQGIDAKRKIVSTFDIRTRPQSAQVNGKIENDEGLFQYPRGVMVRIPGNSGVPGWDIRDRESVVLIVDGFDSDITRARNPVTGETDIISNKSFDDWMKENNLYYNKSGVMKIRK